MRCTRFRFPAALITAFLAAAASTHASTIHVAFDAASGASFSTIDTYTDGDIVSTGTNGTDTWNLGAFGTGGSDSIGSLLLADGSSSGASLSATYVNAANLGGGFDVLGLGSDDDFALFDGVLVMDNSVDSITVSNLPSEFDAGYLVTLYISHADTRSVTFSIGAASAVAQQPTSALFSGDPTGYSATIGVITGSSFTLTGVGAPNARYNLAGISITAIPEPASAGLLLIAAAPFMRRRMK